MKKSISLLALLLAFMLVFAACAPAATTVTTGTTGTTTGVTNINGTTGTQGTTSGTTSTTTSTQGTTGTTNSTTNTTNSTTGTTNGTVTPPEGSEPVIPNYKKSVKILAIGNSFSVDAMEHLAVILKGAGVENIVLGNLYIGGCSLATHMGNINSGAKAYEFYVNTGNGWSKTTQNIDTGILYDDWDVITIQQVSQDSGRPETYTHLQGIIDYVKENCTNEDVKIFWHMTWAYQSGSSHSGFANYDRNQGTMYNAIVNTVKSTILTNSSIDGFIPSGTAIQNLRTSYLGDTLTRDGYHLSNGIGRYTAALMWFKQLTGADISDITAVPSSYPEIAEHLTVIKEAVNNAYANNLQITNSANSEYVNDLLVMTDADKAYITSLGLDPAKYEVLDLKIKFNAYYNSTASSNFAKLTTTAANSPQFFATAIFTPQTLPAGSLVYIAEGYQYRLEGWQKLSTKNSQTRLDNATSNFALDGTEYANYNFLAFNISKVDGSNIVYDDRTAFRIYVPVAEEESTALTDDDKAYLAAIGLNPDNYEKVALDYTLFAYYNCSSNMNSAPNGKVDNNLVNFISTRPIAKDEIPNGSIIRVDKGYQYRPEGWPDLNTSIASSTRPANVVGDKDINYVVVNDAWWGTYTYRGFNVAVKGNSAVVSMETGTHFVIYDLKDGAEGGEPTAPPEEIVPTTVEGWFAYHKLDMSNYELLEFTPVLHAYYYSNSTENYGTNLVTTVSNCPNFWATKEFFTKETLPVGSLIFIDAGYQYRPEGWQELNTNNTKDRPANETSQCFVVTEEFWKDYNYRSFNVSKVGGGAITDATYGVLKIYVPKA